MVSPTSPRMRLLGAALLVGALVALAGARPAAAAGPQDDLKDANAIVGRALAAAQTGDLAGALSEYRAFENRWFDIEDGVREVSRESYRAIEASMSQVSVALAAAKPDGPAAVTALAALDAQNRAFIAGQPPVAASRGASTASTTAASPSGAKPTVATLLDQLAATRAAVQAGDFAAATARFDAFGSTWVDVEGEIKTRSSADYRATEDDMARVATALAAKSPEAAALLDGMTARLTPYTTVTAYRPFDATIIVFREGMEAMLVVVALVAFLKRSGNEDKSRWIWWGAIAGLGASIALGVAINAILGKAFTGENRELMEGATGLVAAAMLLYVSYWLHSKSSLGAWQRYIGDHTARALASGSLYGLTVLAFLAVFREGGETVLFFLGMAGNISTNDLLLGLAIGAVILAVLGFLLTVVGLRIPLRPFFTVASVLTFYLCFKFLGTGIHALQVAGVLPAATARFLPSSDTLGLFPTWQSTVPQFVVLTIAIVIASRAYLADRAIPRRGDAAHV